MSLLNAPRDSVINPGVRLRKAWAWTMYDFANSGYTTVVITAVFNAYFVRVGAGAHPGRPWRFPICCSSSWGLCWAPGPTCMSGRNGYSPYPPWAACSSPGPWPWPTAGGLAVATIALLLSNFLFGAGENLTAAFLLPTPVDEA